MSATLFCGPSLNMSIECPPPQALTVAQARDELRRAVADLSQRCLHFGSKWAAEQLVGLERAGELAAILRTWAGSRG